MRAISLIQPHAWAIAYGGCGVLNREGPPKTIDPKEWIAIHAAKGWDDEFFAWLRVNAIRLGIPLCPERGRHHAGKVVAVCRIPGVFLPVESKKPKENPDPWFRGPVGWHLHDVMRLPDPVECRGAPGIFELPEGVEGAIDLSLVRRRACHSCEKAREQRWGPPTCPLKEDPAVHDAGGCAAWRPR